MQNNLTTIEILDNEKERNDPMQEILVKKIHIAAKSLIQPTANVTTAIRHEEEYNQDEEEAMPLTERVSSMKDETTQCNVVFPSETLKLSKLES